jgi:glycosyltransferase involved in cell wall biosynthesis
MTKVFFSICIPVYNGEKFVRETIQSVLDQDFRDFEVLIVDNASTDKTSDIISSFEDQRIRVIRNTINVPAWENWSIAIGAAQGLWTKLLCADDLLHSSALSKSAQAIANFPDVKIFAGYRNVIDQHGNQVLSSRTSTLHLDQLDQSELVRQTLRSGSNPLGESLTLLWNSSLTNRIGNFSSRWKYFIDLDYWIRLAELAPIVRIPEEMGSFRISPGSWTSSMGLNVISEAREFFLYHDVFSKISYRKKLQGLLMASIKAILRKVFLFVRLKNEKSKNQESHHG